MPKLRKSKIVEAVKTRRTLTQRGGESKEKNVREVDSGPTLAKS
jgi:hypothetical protein